MLICSGFSKLSEVMIKKLQRLERLHHLINRKQTGSAQMLAQKLGVSRSTIYYLIADLKQLGAPVAYCNIRHTFYYKYEVVFNIGFKIVE